MQLSAAIGQYYAKTFLATYRIQGTIRWHLRAFLNDQQESSSRFSPNDPSSVPWKIEFFVMGKNFFKLTEFNISYNYFSLTSILTKVFLIETQTINYMMEK